MERCPCLRRNCFDYSPLIEPLRRQDGARNHHDADRTIEIAGHDLVQQYWQKQHTGADFDAFWRKSLHDGFVAGTTYAPKTVAMKAASFPASQSVSGGDYEINFRRDPSIYDGRFSNNGWLQELPKPLTKLTWDNPIMIGPALAKKRNLNFKDVVELEYNGQKVKGPIWIRPAIPTTRSRYSWVTGALVPDASAPAWCNVYPTYK